ncbi:hypothetical protein [Nocardia rhizosphaerae]|uniref:Uncharacterized protein n=1 Tax=Nocardia rhizosphaerae TaxID=1691571 RepID=A0ABV8KZF5_9NOCA
MAEEPQRDEPMVTSTAAFLDEVPIPVEAHLTESILVFLRATVAEFGGDDPGAVPAYALAPMLIALGRLEVDLADARARIAELERAIGRRDGHG